MIGNKCSLSEGVGRAFEVIGMDILDQLFV